MSLREQDDEAAGISYRAEYTIDSGTEVACTRADCAWAFETEGLYTWQADRSTTPDIDHEPYTATIEYVPDFSGYTAVTWVEENGTNTVLHLSFVQVIWTSETEATLDDLPEALGGCYAEATASCDFSGALTVVR